MQVYELINPGGGLKSDDKDWVAQTQLLITILQRHFFDANVAFLLFAEQRAVDQPSRDRQSWNADRLRLDEIRSQVENELGRPNSREAHEAILFETDVRFKRERWAGGCMPEEFEQQKLFIYARAFVYALDGFDRMLEKLCKEPGVPDRIAAIHASISAAFPDLRGVRDTAHHLEDRARRQAKSKPIPAGGVLALEVLDGTTFGSTMANGMFGQVDVSAESMEKFQGIMQEVLNAFEWWGCKEHLPAP